MGWGEMDQEMMDRARGRLTLLRTGAVLAWGAVLMLATQEYPIWTWVTWMIIAVLVSQAVHWTASAAVWQMLLAAAKTKAERDRA